MPPPRHRSRRYPDALAVLLGLALLLAQWSGFQHRIAHGGIGHPAAGVAVVAGGGELAHHSCLVFDAAALAAGIHSAIVSRPPPPNRYARAPWRRFASWRAPFSGHFLTRAPPAA